MAPIHVYSAMHRSNQSGPCGPSRSRFTLNSLPLTLAGVFQSWDYAYGLNAGQRLTCQRRRGGGTHAAPGTSPSDAKAGRVAAPTHHCGCPSSLPNDSQLMVPTRSTNSTPRLSHRLRASPMDALKGHSNGTIPGCQ